ncbi:hypothetical protein E3V16_08770 [Streptococcus pseudopneumoniae]|nr:hypothetical protein [Streptococcus pseudopneumoniae]NIB91206.1 hypothetical protein [Streptococcus pseudopneumoniae]NIB94946.1 hypothetical protein [Streptococcus pseudopneumoniae]TMR69044.1 hypothetical protein E3V16_08770 [Streptococcus pseudopneumoniae]
MDIVVHGWPTNIHLDLTVLNRDKFSQITRHGVVDFNHKIIVRKAKIREQLVSSLRVQLNFSPNLSTLRNPLLLSHSDKPPESV